MNGTISRGIFKHKDLICHIWEFFIQHLFKIVEKPIVTVK